MATPRIKIFKRDNYTCVYCNSKFKRDGLQVDHVIPKSKGGSNNICNLVTACEKCNITKNDKTLQLFMELANRKYIEYEKKFKYYKKIRAGIESFKTKFEERYDGKALYRQRQMEAEVL